MKNFRRISVPFIFIGISLFIASCNKENAKIDYKTADGYFILNSIENDGAYEKKFASREDFDKYFGMATTMNSTPTNIDFNKDFAAAYIMPVTNLETTINVDSVIWNGHKTEMWLSIQTGDTMSYSIRPVKILLIDKKYNGEVTSFVTSYKGMND